MKKAVHKKQDESHIKTAAKKVEHHEAEKHLKAAIKKAEHKADKQLKTAAAKKAEHKKLAADFGHQVEQNKSEHHKKGSGALSLTASAAIVMASTYMLF